jgi:hypothetical protein
MQIRSMLDSLFGKRRAARIASFLKSIPGRGLSGKHSS